MINQELIFARALGFYPELRRRFASPFRPDTQGNCYVQWKGSWLRWFDWARPDHNYANCWDIIAISKWGHKISNDREKQEVDRIIREIDGPISLAMPVHEPFEQTIRYEKRSWEWRDIQYWRQFGIGIADLSGEVYPVKSFTYNSELEPHVFSEVFPQDLCYAYDYGKHVKIYRPEQKKRYLKWKTNCKPYDFNIFKGDETLVMCGSYKDGKVAHIETGHTVQAFQSENQITWQGQLLLDYSGYKNLLWMGDVDAGGIENTKYVLKTFKEFGVSVKNLYLTNEFNASDLAEIKTTLNGQTNSYINYLIAKSISGAGV